MTNRQDIWRNVSHESLNVKHALLILISLALLACFSCSPPSSLPAHRKKGAIIGRLKRSANLFSYRTRSELMYADEGPNRTAARWPERMVQTIGIFIIVFLAVKFLLLPFALSASARGQLLDFHSSLSLGMTQDDVAVAFGRADYSLLRLKSSHERMAVLTPMEFGARNWVLYLGFAESALDSIRIRTTDDSNTRPEDAPMDIPEQMKAMMPDEVVEGKVTAQLADRYFSKEELGKLMATCSTSNDVVRMFGEEFEIVRKRGGDVRLIYFAEEGLDIVDETGGISILVSSDGEVLQWEPVITYRTISTYDHDKAEWQLKTR